MFTSKGRCQRTVSKKVSVKGTGLFSGVEVNMTFLPANVDTGIVFKRIDLDGNPVVEACISNLHATPRCTIIGKDGVFITCVEHVLSALAAFKLDNVIIELDGGEPPVFDGSSKEFVSMIEQAEVVDMNETTNDFFLNSPVSLELEGMTLIALPSNELKYSYTLSYPGHPLLDSQFHEYDFSEEVYRRDIAPCRTFAPLKEVEILIKKQIIKNTSLDTGIVLDGDKIMGSEGLRFTNEMARHKILDLMGDLSLVGKAVIAHYISIKSGHNLNTLLAKKLYEGLKEK